MRPQPGESTSHFPRITSHQLEQVGRCLSVSYCATHPKAIRPTSSAKGETHFGKRTPSIRVSAGEQDSRRRGLFGKQGHPLFGLRHTNLPTSCLRHEPGDRCFLRRAAGCFI